MNSKNTKFFSKINILAPVILVVLCLSVYAQDEPVKVEGAGLTGTELAGGSWVLTNVEQKSYNKTGTTNWQTTGNQAEGVCSWKDVLEIVHTVNSGFKWQEPPQRMQPGTYMNLEAIYTNNEYSTTGKMNMGVKMFFDKVGANYMAMNSNGMEVLRMNKNYSQNATEVKKGFFYAPKTYFDDSNQCQLIVDCYVGQDHYVTTYTYTYQP